MRHFGNHTGRRRGYTLIELVIATGVSSMLLVGLPSSLYIVSQSVSSDNSTIKSVSTAEIQTRLINDLQLAVAFGELTTNAVTMTVPDRDNNGRTETIRYAWSGTAGDPLMYQYNGGTAAILSEDVHEFDLSFLTRTIAGPVIPDPEVIVDEDELLRFGHDTPFNNNQDNMVGKIIATYVTLEEDGILQSISAYLNTLDRDEVFYLGIYTDNNEKPGTLLVYATGEGEDDNPHWVTLPVTETTLNAGNYWLAIGLTDRDQEYYFQEAKNEKVLTAYANSNKSKLASSWPASASYKDEKVSIYGNYIQSKNVEIIISPPIILLPGGWDFDSLFNFK